MDSFLKHIEDVGFTPFSDSEYTSHSTPHP
jgi:hypothetical protein